MTLPVSPEIALAMLRQERLRHLAARSEADEKVRIIDAQIGGAEMVLQIQGRAAEAAVEVAPTPEATEEKVD